VLLPPDGSCFVTELHSVRGMLLRWVLRAQGLLADRQRPLIEGLGLCILTLFGVEPGQAIEAEGHVGVLRAQGLFPDRQRTLIERLGLWCGSTTAAC
jgi:hypothetical protein